MNRFCIAIALVVACVGAVSAKGHHGGHFGGGIEEAEIEGGFGGGHGGFGHHLPIGQFSDEILIEELRSRGHFFPAGHGGIRHGGFNGKRSGGGFRPFRGGANGGAIGAGAIGGIGGAEQSSTKLGAVGAAKHAGSHTLAEGKKGSVVAGQKHFNVGEHDSNANENSGLHKHQVINNDKTIVSEHNNGVNDVDAFHNSNAQQHGNHLSSGASGLAAEQAGGRFENNREMDSEFGAVGAANQQSAAAGAVGAIGGGAIGGSEF